MKLNFEFGLIPILTIVFVVLKLCDVIAWSWWWIFSPIWIGIGFTILAVMAAKWLENGRYI